MPNVQAPRRASLRTSIVVPWLLLLPSGSAPSADIAEVSLPDWSSLIAGKLGDKWLRKHDQSVGIYIDQFASNTASQAGSQRHRKPEPPDPDPASRRDSSRLAQGGSTTAFDPFAVRRSRRLQASC